VRRACSLAGENLSVSNLKMTHTVLNEHPWYSAAERGHVQRTRRHSEQLLLNLSVLVTKAKTAAFTATAAVLDATTVMYSVSFVEPI
jgi:hypothetical protein